MRIVIDTTRVTTPISNFVSRTLDNMREASLNRQARKMNRQMDNLGEIIKRAEQLNAAKQPQAKRTTRKQLAAKHAKR